MDLKKQLQLLGYTEKEVEIYLDVLKYARATPAEISKRTKIKRPNVYNIAKVLISKGLIGEDMSDRSLTLVALSPSNLKNEIEKNKIDIIKKEEQIDEIITSLNNINAEKKYPVPKLRFIEEQDLKDYLFHNAMKWNESAIAVDGIWHGFQDHSFVENYLEWIDWTIKKFKNMDYKVQLFTNNSIIEKELKGKIPVRNVKFLGESNFTSTMWVVGEYVVMISTNRHPFYLVEFHDITMANNLREVYKKLWSNDSN